MRPRVDDNHAEIVAALREIDGVTVHSTAVVGDGFPDICVGYRNRTFIFEIKDPEKPPSERKLTPKQVIFHGGWRGQVHVIETVREIINVIQ